jgi:membrane dipeptidase
VLELVLRRAEANPFAERWLPQLEAGGVRVQICPLYAAEESDPRAAALAQLEALDRAVRENARSVVRVRTRDELDTALAGDCIGLVLSLEGLEALKGDPAAFAEWWERGVRMASLTWNHANAFAGGVDTPGEGLSSAGREVVTGMSELGAILDLAHASPRTFDDVLALAPDAAGLCVTHAGCRALHDHARNVDDERLRALADRGGVFGVMALTLTVGRPGGNLERLLDHVDHAVGLMGIEHVALGADFVDQVIRVELAAGSELDDATREALEVGGGRLAIPEVTGPADYPVLVDGLRRRAYDGERLDAILSGNWLRLLRAGLPEA